MADYDNYIQANYDTKTLIVPDACRVVGAQGDNLCRSLPFYLVNDPDLMTTSSGTPEYYIVWKNAGGLTGRDAVNPTAVTDGVVIDYTVPAALCQYRGRVEIGVCIQARGKEWHAAFANFYVERFPTSDSLLSGEDLAYVNGVWATDAQVDAMLTDVFGIENLDTSNIFWATDGEVADMLRTVFS